MIDLWWVWCAQLNALTARIWFNICAHLKFWIILTLKNFNMASDLLRFVVRNLEEILKVPTWNSAQFLSKLKRNFTRSFSEFFSKILHTFHQSSGQKLRWNFIKNFAQFLSEVHKKCLKKLQQKFRRILIKHSPEISSELKKFRRIFGKNPR